jgi:hypothetical protein
MKGCYSKTSRCNFQRLSPKAGRSLLAADDDRKAVTAPEGPHFFAVI